MRRCPPLYRALRVASLAAALWLGAGISIAKAGDITVFAAASLKTALDEVAERFEANTGYRVTRSYAGSSALARQIEQGAPASIFISANAAWMDYLAKGDLIDPATRYDLLGNRLVLIAPAASARPVTLAKGMELAAYLDGKFLAMALVDAVPAGIYGKAALDHFGLWDGIAGQVAQTDNVRAALALVALGEAPLGITYETDARAEPKVAIVATFPHDSHPPIRYPVAAIKGQDSAGNDALLDFLKSPDAAQIFAHHGFAVLER